jgi:cleavage and polyadenylation specificity factor subunit 3
MWVAISSFSGRVQDVMNEPEEVMSQKGNPIQRKISVDYISFSAHVDYSQNSEFIELVKAQHVVRLFGLPSVFSL